MCDVFLVIVKPAPIVRANLLYRVDMNQFLITTVGKLLFTHCSEVKE